MAEFTVEEKALIEAEFDRIIQACPEKSIKKAENIEQIRKAFDLACKAHDGVRRKSGEPYIVHPIAVAKICASEIGLGTKSVVCALLHDVVEDTEYSLEYIAKMFDGKTAAIIDGLTKIRGVLDTETEKAENFRKMLLTLSEDVRVILIKLADRLHNMRTLGSMTREKQLKISAETRILFAPLAHRLGLYAIKTELEDLCLKYEHPAIYEEITQKLHDSEEKRQWYLHKFTIPITMKLESEGLEYQLTGRPKSISSIWHKIKTKNVKFEDIYDLFAVRIVINDVPLEFEKNACWRIYSLVTDLYQPSPERLRDWIATPRDNGYEALHTTVMGPEGRFVEVQIRTQRMDEIAERGYAAHWKYKEAAAGQQQDENQLDMWLKRLRVTLEDPDIDPQEFLDEFKLNLYTSEIYVFTPKGELRRMPKGATVLDLAYDIHSNIGNHAVAAKINRHKTVPLDYKLESGDQVQIITSDKQTPQLHWIDIVVTARAKNKLRDIFKNERKKLIKNGQELVESLLKEFEITSEERIFTHLMLGYSVSSKADLFYKLATTNNLDKDEFKKIALKKRENRIIRYWKVQLERTLQLVTDPLQIIGGDDVAENQQQNHEHAQPNVAETKTVHIGEGEKYKIANCCKPIPGDKLIGFVEKNTVVIHKDNCEKAIAQQVENVRNVVAIKWVQKKEQAFLVRLKINGIDRVGLMLDVTGVISTQLNINMRTVHFDTSDKSFDGFIDLYIHNLQHLNNLIESLEKVSGVKSVKRVEKFD